MTVAVRLHAQVALVVLAVVGLASAGWIFVPAKSATWLIAMASMAVIWLIVALVGWARPFAEHSTSERRFLVTSVAAAGLVFALALARVLAKTQGFDGGELIDRGAGVAVGLILVLLGNTLPKILTPLTAKRCAPAQVVSIQRLAGWVFVLAGLLYAAAWAFLPIVQAQAWSDWPVMAAVAIVIARYAWAFIGPSSSRSSELG
jgi:hypothetical protein